MFVCFDQAICYTKSQLRPQFGNSTKTCLFFFWIVHSRLLSVRFGEINYGWYVESEGWVKGKTVVKPAVFCRGELVHRLQSGVHTVARHITRLLKTFYPPLFFMFITFRYCWHSQLRVQMFMARSLILSLTKLITLHRATDHFPLYSFEYKPCQTKT